MKGITAQLKQHTKTIHKRLAMWATLLLLIFNFASITQRLGFVDPYSDSIWNENPLALAIPPYDPPNTNLETAQRRLGIEQLVSLYEIPYGLRFDSIEKDAPEGDDTRALSTVGLRCAAFGGSDTWGSTKFIPPDRRRELSYPYQMCKNVDNYGFFSQGPNYAQACLQSMIGDDKRYDLITLDFDKNPAEARNVAERLRRRFPKATILILDRYLPYKVILVEKNNQQPYNSFRKHWGRRSRKDSSFHLETFFKRIRNYQRVMRERKGIFRTSLRYRHSMKTEYGQIDRNFDAHTITLGNEKDIEQSVLDTFGYYVEEGTLLNRAGHTHVAKIIKDKVEELNVKRNDEIGDWGDGDLCDVWFNSGETNNVKWGPNIHMINYDPLRYALEIPPEGGWVEITNPFKGPRRRLYASYVVTPGLKTIHSSAHFSCDTGEINRHVNTKAFDKLGSIMTPKTLPLGKIGEGKHKIFITPDNNGEKNFWLVGLSISDKQHRYDPAEFGFAMSFW
eukprot:CAMPEP_0195283302 /NCGR_PEP_ID=MMETSP0707-20130614/1893_1 /TAXON_ID=33640 /ORGANISM="Asterionellopsis glacialis, Strain CCMP134" /LENGTH=505 /DNA_ID=CAMNT_0040342445 /DNA_START=156 /DNA_END=1670 /DNA_ORIENTATION=-